MSIRWGTFLLVLSVLYVWPIWAMYEHQAGVFDWHHMWVGHPREAVQMDQQIIVYSERNVLASLDADTGEVVWRQVLENQLEQFATSEAGILTLSSGPERAQFWNKTNGQLIWEYTPQDAFGSTQPLLTQDGQALVMLDSTRLVKLDQGSPVWTWTRKANENQVFEKMQLIQHGHAIYVVAEPDEDAGSPYFFIHRIDSATGETLSSFKVPCGTEYAEVNVIGHALFWQENDIFKWTPLDQKQVKTVSIASLVKSLPTADSFTPNDIRLIGHVDHTSFILTANVEEEEGSTSVSVMVHMEQDGLVLGNYFGEQASFGAVDFEKGKLTRVVKTSPEELTVSIWPDQKEFEIKHDFSLSGSINYVKLLQSSPLRFFVVTEGSSVFVYNETSVVWSREEALSNIAAAEFIDLPEQKLEQRIQDQPPLARYLSRLTYHLSQLRHVPRWIFQSHAPPKPNLISSPQSCWVNQSVSPILYRDHFGLHKIIVSATKSGKIIAQDSQQGRVVWTRYIRDVSFDQVYLVRAASTREPPLVVAIGQTYDEMEGQTTTGFVRLNALTGQDYVTQIPAIQDYFEAVVSTNIGVDKVMPLPIEDPDERTQILAVYEAGTGRIYIYPDTQGARQQAVKFLPTFYFTHQSTGYRVVESYRGSLRAEPIWKLSLPDEEQVVTTSVYQQGKVASLGRALGNRHVLYKYLNPHVVGVVSQTPEAIKVRLMDTIKGSILYETVHEGAVAPVHIVQAEHWFVYHFWSHQTKSYQVAVLELFEGAEQDQRIESTHFSSFEHIEPHVIASAFTFPYPVHAMGVTHTRNGISTKDIVFALPNQLVGFNKRLFDPRRPLKPTKEDQEEQLIPYGPIPDEKRLFLSYHLPVIGIQSIMTSPSLLESTSLVFAFGLDSFFTKDTPSKQFDVLSEDFSKAQLLLTMAGLVVGILIAGPMVRKKRVNALWK